jgi:HEAT repeat protein
MPTNLNIASLVAQMPETDKEIEARKAAEKQAQQPADPNAKPKPPKADRTAGGSKFTGPDPGTAAQWFDQVLAGGTDALNELAALVIDPADPAFKDYKAEYFLHGLAIHVGAPGRDAQRRLVVQALVAHLGNAKLSAHVRGFFVRELRVIGTRDASAAIGRLLADETLCADSAAALVSIADAEPLRAAVPAAKGRCRLAALQCLAVLSDEKSAPAFRAALADADTDARLIAAWGLARIGDTQAIDAMLKLSLAEAAWERSKATQACLLLAETLVAAGRRGEARRIYVQLRATHTQPNEAYLRELADKALLALGIG